MTRFANAASPATTVLSIVCAMRNVAHCVDGLLASYRRERRHDTQLIAIDAASKDGTWDVLLNHQDLIDVAVSEPDTGVYDAWNKALPLCTGRYVCFIGADDRLADGAILHLVDACQSAGDSHVVAGFNILTRQGVPVALLGAPYDAAQIHRRMMVAQVMSAHRADWLRSVNGFDASYKSSGDYELLLRERADLKVTTLNAILSFMEDGGTSRTGMTPHVENFHARRRNGVALWLSSALLGKALLGSGARRLGLRR
jgi:glycosyltransferase involved in cell wall biosynthesis